MSELAALQAVRDEIDRIDRELVRAINQRAQCALEVARIKRESGLAGDLYRGEREAQVLRGVREMNPGPLSDDEVVRLVREIMSSCLALEQPISVAYFGPAGTYTHTAARKHFGGAAALLPLKTIEEVLRAVGTLAADFGVVPIENSYEGSVNQTLDSLRDSRLQVCGEVVLEVHHQLLTTLTELAAVRRIYAHPQALAQCRRWLDTYCPLAERVPATSNAEGAHRAASEPAAAAIAGEMAASIYQLPILARNIEDDPANTTRFLVLGRVQIPPSGADLTSLLFVAPNRAGALHDILQAFAQAQISMTRIESRPLRQGPWEYVFFVDIEGHQSEPAVAAALAQVAERSSQLRILGSYPRAAL
ncbi:MAG: prephenate dehydratase [Gammaproteobacteria bacterium]|nr:prephenate dehydratase [Gammaproteobacteria bacterium]